MLVTGIIVLILLSIGSMPFPRVQESASDPTLLTVRYDTEAGTLSVFRSGEETPLVTHHVRPDFRPYMHPITAPDGQGVLTESTPAHHPHQTGLFWGLTRVNGRDYFHHPGAAYWKRVSVDILVDEGTDVKWRTMYRLLDEAGEPVLTETQVWTMREDGARYLLDLEWRGEAETDVTIGEHEYGGLFLRMPWREGMESSVVNAARQRNQAAEGKRAMWLDVGMKVDGRDDMAHVALFDHPDNVGFPQPWRVDGELGVGPAPARLGGRQIERGETEVIRHRLVIYTGTMSDIELRDLWEGYSGEEGQYSVTALWGLAQREGRQAEFLTPERAAGEMTLPEGFDVNAWAGEPLMTQPMAFAWDDRGRLWVAENRDYESRSTGFSASGDSRILIIEDTDRDGKADSRKVFLEGIPFPSAVAVGFDGVFIGAPPHLLFVPDRDRDDVAERDDIEILLTGWGIRDRHETINSFHWGPDGWLYGLEGFATPSKIHKPDEQTRLYNPGDPFPEDILEGEGVEINGGVWRYHPVKERFEVVAHGFSNPWGIDYDAKGEFFITACVIPHVFHVIPGGIYHRQGGQHFNPYVYSDIQTIVDHRHRSAHGGARIYQSDAFPEEHRGRLFMANIHEHAVLSDVLAPAGSGFTASHGEDFMTANNAQWIGFSMEVGPEGALYVLDWHDADICGEAVLDKDTGRIFRITPTTSHADDWNGRYSNLAEMSDLRLAEMQTSESSWHSRRARVILQHRAANGSIDSEAEAALNELLDAHPNSDYRLRGMWALHVTGLLAHERLLDALEDDDEYVRAWAVQLLLEDKDPGATALDTFARMARSDGSAVVRKYLAAGLQRVEEQNRWEIAEGLLGRGEDAGDHNIPKLVWFGVEPLVAEETNRALALAAGSKIPLVTEFIARRVVDADAMESLTAALGQYGEARVEMLQGMRAGLEGRTGLRPPAGWASVYEMLREDEDAAPIAIEVAQYFGDDAAAGQLLERLMDDAAPTDQRKRALNGLASQRREELIPELPTLLDEAELRVESIRAVAAFDHDPLGVMLLEKYTEFDRNERREALRALASRPSYGWMLTEALKSGDIPKREVPADVARQLRRVVGSGFVEVWGPIDEDPSDDSEAYAQYRALLTPEAVDGASPSRGRQVFERTCGACHMMYGEGGAVGPDLTGSNRTDLDYILTNVLEPSAVIQDDYKMVVITTRDGRTVIGNVSSETDRQVTLRVVGRDEVVLNTSEIQSRELSANSLMPEGLFRTLSDEEVLDLVSYLHTAEQVPASDE